MISNQPVTRLSQHFLFALIEIMGAEIEKVRAENKGLTTVQACPTKKYFNSLKLMEHCYTEVFGSLNGDNVEAQRLMRDAWILVRISDYSLSQCFGHLH